ncbi:MAG: ABC transporter ATP-binding protein [Candidatus Dormibacteraeota bacterium]|nr:ABC transporter ATP-binding protein [Candidatus Dormibacteraeota bacterium]
MLKTYGATRANDGVDLDVAWREVHALLGENGAGKSTLMNVVYGLAQPDAGEILFDGRPVDITGPPAAIGLGIGMVHQHFMLVPPLTVAENVVLGHETAGAGGWMDVAQARRMVSELSARYHLEVDPAARVEDLSVGAQQRVEILKALYRGARLLILDEPTAVLTPQETQDLFEIVRRLTSEGSAVIFITHKLGEVMDVADRITVMRRGRVVATTQPESSSPADLARLMVGRPVILEVDKEPVTPGRPLLQLADLTVLDDRRQTAVDGLTLEVRAGEIVGIAGVEGNGQTELVEAITGLRPARAGTIVLDGRDITHISAKARLVAGLGHIPEDRHRLGMILELPISDNLILDRFDQRPFARGIVRRFDAVEARAAELIEEYDIRAGGAQLPASSLSGGNQQKVVVARELGGDPGVLVAAQPTRGVDVGSIEFIHRRLVERRDQGHGVLLISSELDEVLSLSDRVVVMYRGRAVAEIDGARAETERERIGLLMAGAA